MWLWGGGSVRHRQRTIWSRKIARELLSLERELRNMGEGSLGLGLGPSPSSSSQDCVVKGL